MLVGVLSDTHGVLPEGIGEAFRGVERIVHAGDIGPVRIISELEAIAPVIAVRGNMDTGELGWRLPDRAVVNLADRRIVIVHDPTAVGDESHADVVVTGHTHRATVERRGDTLYVSPGSAGAPGRDGRGPTVALLDLAADPPAARIIDL